MQEDKKLKTVSIDQESKKIQIKQNTYQFTSEEDSVVADIQRLKNFLNKILKVVSFKAKPVAEHSVRLSDKTIKEAKNLIDKSFLKKLIKVFFILVFIVILMFILAKFLILLKEDGNGKISFPGAPTTPIPYQPYKQSVYAQDPETLELEENINILEKELIEVSLREDQLLTPTLDYDVNF